MSYQFIASYVVFVIYYYTGHFLTPALVLSTINIMEQVRLYAVLIAGMGFQFIVEFNILLKRMCDIMNISQSDIGNRNIDMCMCSKTDQAMLKNKNLYAKFVDFQGLKNNKFYIYTV